MRARYLLPAATIAALAVVVALPFAFVLLQAIFPHFVEGSLAGPASTILPTLRRPETLTLIGNTLRLGLLVAVGAALTGGTLGVLRGLFRIPGARLWDLMFLVPFLIPPYLAALGWI